MECDWNVIYSYSYLNLSWIHHQNRKPFNSIFEWFSSLKLNEILIYVDWVMNFFKQYFRFYIHTSSRFNIRNGNNLILFASGFQVYNWIICWNLSLEKMKSVLNVRSPDSYSHLLKWQHQNQKTVQFDGVFEVRLHESITVFIVPFWFRWLHRMSWYMWCVDGISITQAVCRYGVDI